MPKGAKVSFAPRRAKPYEKREGSPIVGLLTPFSSSLPLDEQANEGGPSTSETDFKPDHRKNKRNRVTLSCWHCHKNKRKCDRGYPACDRCKAHNNAAGCVYEHDVTRPCPDPQDELARQQKRIHDLETILRLYRGKQHVEVPHRETYDWCLTIPETLWHIMMGAVDNIREVKAALTDVEPLDQHHDRVKPLHDWLDTLERNVLGAMTEAKKSRRLRPSTDGTPVRDKTPTLPLGDAIDASQDSVLSNQMSSPPVEVMLSPSDSIEQVAAPDMFHHVPTMGKTVMGMLTADLLLSDNTSMYQPYPPPPPPYMTQDMLGFNPFVNPYLDPMYGNNQLPDQFPIMEGIWNDIGDSFVSA
ncbi:hypothetical protein DACRYDRAFT_21513 [Dacryopinax primogenitus]|uniref:Zn(2)-C6 fungal-type domain-containing protein n=1 Tax=Dacryopinax primogenitus (strain DJM 731) TaxID=1858805 RepID=M5FZ24_DACPD|nr:uncharacterized protein DACRYDRAFT_21513 [Dacryopinax primogenitus]EJU03296.1 hypothetical protein DACRYDRAFT_21513 [Dacryopinax primogenitus]